VFRLEAPTEIKMKIILVYVGRKFYIEHAPTDRIMRLMPMATL
jgi:hypothetical protein